MGAIVAKRLSEGDLKKLALEELIRLSEKIEKLIASRLSIEKRLLDEKLLTIKKYQRVERARAAGASSDTAGKPRPRTKVALKYRHPKTGAGWSGRGLVPRWLAAEIANGGTREDFRIRPEMGNGKMTESE
jgi:DNA-binding protein H-NS